MRTVYCPICNTDIQVRSGFAHETLLNHIKAHPKDSEVQK